MTLASASAALGLLIELVNEKDEKKDEKKKR
jgi:hypothetical protein